MSRAFVTKLSKPFRAQARVESFKFGRPTHPSVRPVASPLFPSLPTMSRSSLLLLLLVCVGIAATHAQGQQTVEQWATHSGTNSELRESRERARAPHASSPLGAHWSPLRCVLCWRLFVRACSDSCRCDCCIVRQAEQTAMQGRGPDAAQRRQPAVTAVTFVCLRALPSPPRRLHGCRGCRLRSCDRVWLLSGRVVQRDRRGQRGGERVHGMPPVRLRRRLPRPLSRSAEQHEHALRWHERNRTLRVAWQLRWRRLASLRSCACSSTFPWAASLTVLPDSHRCDIARMGVCSCLDVCCCPALPAENNNGTVSPTCSSASQSRRHSGWKRGRVLPVLRSRWPRLPINACSFAHFLPNVHVCDRAVCGCSQPV